LAVSRIIIWLGLVWYSSFLLLEGIDILAVSDQLTNQLGLLAVIFLGWFMILMWVRPICFPKMKLTHFFLGIFLIFMARMYFQDDPANMVFVWDILRILGVLNIILGPLGICIPTKCKKLQEEKEVEIIEV